MKCSDVERILPDIIDGIPVNGARANGDQDVDLQSHLKTCPECSELVSDLKLIASGARQFAASEEPAPRLWVKIAAELRAEGIIHDLVPAMQASSSGAIAITQPSPWRAFWLAPVAVAILAAGSWFLTHKAGPAQTPQVAKQTVVQPSPPSEPQIAQQLAPQPPQAAVPQPAAKPLPRSSALEAAAVPAQRVGISAPPSADDRQFLSDVSTLSPTMRTSYEDQLQAVNAEIRDTQAYIKQYPGDTDARQHLLEVFQQKAMLYQLALDRIQ